jgi:hypothetical protein
MFAMNTTHDADGDDAETTSSEGYSVLKFTPQRPRFQSAYGQHGQLSRSSRASCSSSPKHTSTSTMQYKNMPPDSAAAQRKLQVRSYLSNVS